jgi:hypothetical protein
MLRCVFGKGGESRPGSPAGVAFTTLVAFSFSLTAQGADPTYRTEESKIPKNPTAPPSLTQQIPLEQFHCERRFVYQAKALDCDSNVQRDGENLRPILQDTPAAVAELDTYQHNRRTLRSAAYVASAGLLVALVGFFATRGDNNFRDFSPGGNGALRPAAYLMLGGAALAAGSFVYGFTVYKTNETHLGNAVSEFNKTHPGNPIELQFSTGISF